MDKQIQEAFQDSLDALDAGMTIEEALAGHQQYADELRPLLEIVTSSAIDTDLSDEQTRDLAHRSRSRMLKHASQLGKQPSGGKSRWIPSLRNRFSFATLIIALVVLLSSTGIWAVSAQSVPGDPLYGLKRQTESLSRSLTTNDVSRYELDLSYRQRRVDEVFRLIELNRLEAVTFEGELLDQETSLWTIENILVIVHADTILKGPFKLGDKVQVNGVTTAAGAVLATSVELRRYHLVGPVEAQVDSFWVIAGRRLDISDAVIEPGAVVGARVDAEVEVDDDGVHRVRWLTLLESPPASASPAVDQTPAPAQTLEFDLIQEFRGFLEGMSSSAIVVDGQTILLGSDTEIEGVLFPGVSVRVEAGQAQDGAWIALEIKVDAEEEADDQNDDDAKSDDDDESGDESEEPDDDDPDGEDTEESDDHPDDEEEEEEEEEKDKK